MLDCLKVMDSIPFSPSQTDKMHELLPELSDKVKLFWTPDIIEDGILGMFSIFTPNNIYVAHIPGMMTALASTVAHEMTHREQFLRNPLLYLVLAIPVVRQYTIEVEAKRVELAVDARLGLSKLNIS